MKIINFLFILICTILTVLLVTDSLAPIVKLLIFNNSGRMAFNDFACFWAAFHALIDGKNPYYYQVIGSYLQGSAFTPTPAFPLPFSYFLFAPIFIFPLYSSILIWFLLSLISIILVPYLAWKIERQGEIYNPLRSLFALTFIPAMQVFFFGQFGLILASCLALGFFLLTQKRDLIAGIVFSFCLFKPAAFLIALVALLMWSIRMERIRIIIGLLMTQIVAFYACNIFASDSLKWWIDGKIAPMDTATASLVTTIRFLTLWLFDYDWKNASIFFPLIGCILTLLYTFRHPISRSDSLTILSRVLILSFTLAPYVWIFDQAVLLLPYSMLWERVIYSGRVSFSSIAILLLINSGVFLIFREYDYQAFWFAPAFLIGSELVLKNMKRLICPLS